ncbi:MAG: alpha/beta hydrolase [Lachnospiraceae bacterium]|nr:alpha/beta hydrolase [Lachnospiraceae bacterium]
MEAPYPAALEDGYLALKWLKEHAKELGVRDSQLFVGGESAGGGLAVAVTMYAR